MLRIKTFIKEVVFFSIIPNYEKRREHFNKTENDYTY